MQRTRNRSTIDRHHVVVTCPDVGYFDKVAPSAPPYILLFQFLGSDRLADCTTTHVGDLLDVITDDLKCCLSLTVSGVSDGKLLLFHGSPGRLTSTMREAIKAPQ